MTQLENNVIDLALQDVDKVDHDDTSLQLEPKGRYVSVHGSYIDQLGVQPHPLVTAALRQNQQVRDQYHHHITLINHLEIGQLMSLKEQEQQKQQQEEDQEQLSSRKKKKLHQKTMYGLCRDLVAQFGSPHQWQKPVDLGMGICKTTEATTYFRVIDWPHGQLMRQFLGLGTSHFHITVGFDPIDVHQYKGPATLLCLQEEYACSEGQMNMLIDYAAHYAKDRMYIQRLYKTCWQHGYYSQAGRLTIILTVSLILFLYHKLIKKNNKKKST